MEGKLSRRDLLKSVLPIAGAAAIGLAVPSLTLPVHALTSSPQQEADYIIFQNGGTVYRKNGATGNIEDQGPDASTIVTNAIGVMSDSQRIVVMGPMTITAEIMTWDMLVVVRHGTLFRGRQQLTFLFK